MGVAQSSLNKLGATVGTAALAVSNAAAKGAEAKQAAKEDVAFSQAELAQAEALQAEAGLNLEQGQKVLNEKQEAYDTAMNKKPGGKGNTKAKIAEAQQQALDDLTAAQKAFDVLSKKDTAAKAMTAR